MRSVSVLHLVCFDLPLSPLYGGTEEVDTKIRVLLELGVVLHVHAFVWPSVLRSGKFPDWHQRVASLRCYPRRWFVGPYDTRPWAMVSRTSGDLVRNIACEPGPILIEGWQCADLLRASALKNRVIWVRSHNIESNYYSLQADSASSWMRKLYFVLESWRWRLYERSLPRLLSDQQRRGIFSICPSETLSWARKNLTAHYVPAFVGLSDRLDTEREDAKNYPMETPYALYHGRLDVAENVRAVRFLLTKVNFPGTVPLVIAGSRLPQSLRNNLQFKKGQRLVDTPTSSEMQAWLRHASVHCIPCYGMAGLRFKIIHAMLGGGHVLVSREGVSGMPWSEWVTVIESESDWENQVRLAMESPLSTEQVAARHAWVKQHFYPHINILKVLDLMGITP